MNALYWLCIAYAIMFLGIGCYIAFLSKEQTRLRAMIEELTNEKETS